MKQLALSLVLLPVLACGASSLEKATKAAAKEERPLVIMASASWCGPCKSFKKYVLPNERVQRALGGVRFVILDSERDKGSLAQLGVRSYPTFLVVNREEKPVAMLQGRVPVEKFLDFLRWATPNWFTREQLVHALSSNPTTDTKVFGARWHALHGSFPQAVTLYEQALSGLSAKEEIRRPDLEWEHRLISSVGPPISVLAKRAAELVRSYPSSDGVITALRLVLLSRVFSQEERASIGRDVVLLFNDKPQELNAMTYLLLAAKLSELALQTARRQTELTPKNANAYDTLAEVHHYLGDDELALKESDLAIAKAEASDSRAGYQKNRDRFAAPRFAPSPDVLAEPKKLQDFLRRYKIQP